MKSLHDLSRRDFLKLLGVGAGAFGLPDIFGSELLPGGFSQLGRVLEADTPIYAEPTTRSVVTAVYWQDAVLPIIETIPAEQTGTTTWYRLAELGYLPAEGVQPVRFYLQQPDEGISRQGTLVEVSVPYTGAYFQPTVTSQLLYRYYYGSTHWVNKLIYDRYGQAWYRVEDDKYPEYERWVLASRMRVIPNEELVPLSPDVPPEEKTILVNLGEQTVTAFEYGQAVFTAMISSGDATANPNYQTPTGTFWVGFKRPSQHMLPWDQTFGDYDLPGVPWVCYFSLRAHAFHGAYWHNGFGSPRSHGCVNLTPENARWIYRWTTPVIQPNDDMQAAGEGGTRVEVV